MTALSCAAAEYNTIIPAYAVILASTVISASTVIPATAGIHGHKERDQPNGGKSPVASSKQPSGHAARPWGEASVRKTRLLRGILLALACTASMAVMAQTETARSVNVPAGDLATAIESLRQQIGGEILFRADQLQGARTRGVQGNLAPEEALDRLLEGTGFWTERDSSGAVFIVPSPARPARAAERNPQAVSGTVAGDDEIVSLSSMTVTGTRIRGGATASPVITIGAENIQEEGLTDLGEVIRSIPQNFSGGLNPGVVTATGSGNISNQGGSGGSALNLRGIGPDATLTLLNGRRLAYDGFGQAVDISAIPIEAVERIEIVADGASAIYGSDAVAGVGNVILNRNFEGLAVSARYGRASDGGLNTRDYNVTAGTVWGGGGLMATYKDVSVDPISADQRKYTAHMETPFVLHPPSELSSGLVSGYQQFGESVELRLDALRTRREQIWYQSFSGLFYENQPKTTTTIVSPSMEIFLPGEWSIQIGGSWGKSESLGDAWTVAPSAGESTLAASTCWCNDSYSYELSGEGPIFELGGGQARLAVGAGYRSNELLNENYLSGNRVYGSESSRFVYGEISFPLISAGSDAKGADRLTLTAAARSESYDSFGDVTTPKLGLIYGPSADFTVKASWGRSFKAPTLSSRYGDRYAYLERPDQIGGAGYGEEDAVLLSWGSNADLRPERARTASASLAFHPRSLPGLEAELTLFDIDYGDRVVQPFAAFSQILSNPAVAEFIDWSPTLEQQAALIAEYSYAFFNRTGRPYDPNTVVAIGRGEFTNAMRQRIKGIDLSAAYRFDLGSGRLTVRGSGSWLDSEQRNTPGQDAFDLAGTIFYPAKRNARLGAVWSQGGATASLFANHRSGVTDHIAREKGASFTTFDSTLRYVVITDGRSAPEVEFALSAQNLLNRAPPLYVPAAATVVPYDSTNYSAIGRFVSASVSMRW